MKPQLSEDLVEELIRDIKSADTFAPTSNLEDMIHELLDEYVEIHAQRNSIERHSKVVFINSGTGTSHSVKPYNVVVNLKRLWQDLPEGIIDITAWIKSELLCVQVGLLLRLVRRLAGLFRIKLDRRHETVILAIVGLSHRKGPVATSDIADQCKRWHQCNYAVPLLGDSREINAVLSELRELKVVRRRASKWSLAETIIKPSVRIKDS